MIEAANSMIEAGIEAGTVYVILLSKPLPERRERK
jgi:hypothetical protein